MTDALPVDPEQLGEEVRAKYREVATTPKAKYHFHTGRVWDLNPATFWRRVLLARIRAHQLRREVPASIDAAARELQESAA